MTQAVSIIETWNMKIRTDWRQLVEVPFSKECEYQNRRSPVLSIVAYNLHVSILTEAECCANTITALSLDITMCSNIAPARYNLLLIKANTDTIDNVTNQPLSPSPSLSTISTIIYYCQWFPHAFIPWWAKAQTAFPCGVILITAVFCILEIFCYLSCAPPPPDTAHTHLHFIENWQQLEIQQTEESSRNKAETE